MNRFLAHTSVIALCAACSFMPTSVAHADDAPPAANADAAMPTTLDGQIARAQDLRAKGDLAEAGHSLAQILLVAPDDIRAVGEYGKVLVQQGHSKEAVAFLTHAVQLKGADWTLYSALGVAYDQADDRDDARKAYDHALAMKPGEPSVINNYAVSRMLAGDYAGAHQMLAQLQATGASDPKIAGNLAKAEELKPTTVAAMAPAPAMPVTTAPKAPVAVAAVKIDPATTLMQKVPVDPLAGPVGHKETKVAAAPKKPAHAPEPAPEKVTASTAPLRDAPTTPAPQQTAANTPTAATAAPRALNAPSAPVVVASTQTKIDPATTVMQKVPVDPDAGPVAKAPVKAPVSKAPAKLAAAAKPAPAKAPAKAAAPPPALRTASDN